MPATTRAWSEAARFPLIVVDWARDRDRYDSGFLVLAGPADLPHLTITPTTQTWDGNGRPVTVAGTAVTVTSDAPDPAVRTILHGWRSRVPVPIVPGTMSGETAIPFIVDDVAAARTRLTPAGVTRRPSTALRLLPVLLMLAATVALIPLLRTDILSAALAFVAYVVASQWMARWTEPAAHWGDRERRDPHDVVSRLGVAAKVAFWAVAAAGTTIVVLDWAELMPGLLAWV